MAAVGSLSWLQLAACHGGSWQPVMAAADLYSCCNFPSDKYEVDLKLRGCELNERDLTNGKVISPHDRTMLQKSLLAVNEGIKFKPSVILVITTASFCSS